MNFANSILLENRYLPRTKLFVKTSIQSLDVFVYLVYFSSQTVCCVNLRSHLKCLLAQRKSPVYPSKGLTSTRGSKDLRESYEARMGFPEGNSINMNRSAMKPGI